jgi:LysM repeat protein
VSKADLMELNKLTDPNKIRVGQKLIIPKRAHTAVHPAVKNVEAKSKDKPKAEDKAPAATLATGINEYVVQAGDSLSKISAKLNVKISELREVNKLVNDKLKVGQKLTVPAKKAEGAPESAPAAAASEPALQTTPAAVTPAPAPTPGTPGAVPAVAPAKNVSSGITHTVLANEDLNTIAKLYVVSADDIVAANQMGTNRTVQAGQKIIIPQPQ